MFPWSFRDIDGNPIGPADAEVLLRDVSKRQLARTSLVTDRGTVDVSTVFLVCPALDWETGEIDRWWETMVFGGPLDEHQWRYGIRDEAANGHAEAVTFARLALDALGVAVLADETRGLLVVDPHPGGRRLTPRRRRHT